MTAAQPLPTEIIILALSVVLLVVQILLQSFAATLELGMAYNASPRDEDRAPKSPVAGRLERALRNLLETYPAFAALALALVVTGKSGGWGAAGAIAWFAARVVYVGLYAAGIPYLRSLVWLVSISGLGLMLAALLA